jgi:hypothetical protein
LLGFALPREAERSDWELAKAKVPT